MTAIKIPNTTKRPKRVTKNSLSGAIPIKLDHRASDQLIAVGAANALVICLLDKAIPDGAKDSDGAEIVFCATVMKNEKGNVPDDHWNIDA